MERTISPKTCAETSRCHGKRVRKDRHDLGKLFRHSIKQGQTPTESRSPGFCRVSGVTPILHFLEYGIGLKTRCAAQSVGMENTFTGAFRLRTVRFKRACRRSDRRTNPGNMKILINRREFLLKLVHKEGTRSTIAKGKNSMCSRSDKEPKPHTIQTS